MENASGILQSVLRCISEHFCGVLVVYRLRSARLGSAALRTSITTKIIEVNA